ncbi:hypothetical protein BDV35DRAFT_274352 [Aspergillus flavus]|uniref:Uncharacterized protein n=1 Tax=Aspergillus flavus TaxID=5059 RepID=A0A5N6HCU9_ASPFL|nr:hypothetical protein BDV35DRAFT_274352 [Aspergillus flavus]
MEIWTRIGSAYGAHRHYPVLVIVLAWNLSVLCFLLERTIISKLFGISKQISRLKNSKSFRFSRLHSKVAAGGRFASYVGAAVG